MYKYVPVIRDGSNERSVVTNLRQYGASGSSSLFPAIEIMDEDDLRNLDTYRRVAGQIMVELPLYLMPSDDEHSQAVRDIYGDHGNNLSSFYQSELHSDDIPIVTGQSDRPIDYSNLQQRYNTISGQFDRVAVRIFVRAVDLDQTQIQDLQNLLSNLRDDDIILLDQVDVAGFEHPAYSNLQTIVGNISDNETYILNAFRYQDSPHNYGPVLALDLDIDGFGDFGINRRFNPPMHGSPPTVYIRHYVESDCEIEDFSGPDYDVAFRRLTSSSHFDQNHCHFCQSEAMSGNRDHSTWKRYRMGHYMDCVLDDTLQRMETEGPSTLDSAGYNDLT